MGILAPKYFTYRVGNDIISLEHTTDSSKNGYYYINTMNDKVKRVDSTTKTWVKATDNITEFQGLGFIMNEEGKLEDNKVLTTYDKNQSIIDTINKEIMYYTNGIKLKITNPANTYQINSDTTRRDFNFFDGITFIVIYREESLFSIKDKNINFNQYNMVGYTLTN